MKKPSLIALLVLLLTVAGPRAWVGAKETDDPVENGGSLLDRILDERLEIEKGELAWLRDEADRETIWFEGYLEHYTHFVEGLEQEQSGNYEQALASLEAAMDAERYEVANFEPLFDIGRIYYRLGDFEDAEASLSEYIFHVNSMLSGKEILEWGFSEEYEQQMRHFREYARTLLRSIESEGAG